MQYNRPMRIKAAETGSVALKITPMVGGEIQPDFCAFIFSLFRVVERVSLEKQDLSVVGSIIP